MAEIPRPSTELKRKIIETGEFTDHEATLEFLALATRVRGNTDEDWMAAWQEPFRLLQEKRPGAWLTMVRRTLRGRLDDMLKEAGHEFRALATLIESDIETYENIAGVLKPCFTALLSTEASKKACLTGHLLERFTLAVKPGLKSFIW